MVGPHALRPQRPLSPAAVAQGPAELRCGTGCRLWHRPVRSPARPLGVEVDAVDPSEEVIAEARALAGRGSENEGPRFAHADITEAELPAGHYDFISCLASIHHVAFGTVSALRDALAPGGVLVILGCYREENRSTGLEPGRRSRQRRCRLAAWARDRLLPPLRPQAGPDAGPVKQPACPVPGPLEADALLPGCRIRRLLFWRYLLVFRNSR